MNKSIFTARRTKRGFTMVEVVTALAISAVASIAMITVFIMASRFVAQGFTEARLLTNASIALEKVTRQINHAYRADASIAANRFAIATDKRTITFSVPNTASGTNRQRYRYNATTNELFFEQSGAGGGFASVTTGPLLRNVEEFLVENQEGILSIVLSMRQDMGRNGDKRYTMVGRALPRNL